MPVFEYTARTLKGDLVTDKVDLPSKDDVVAHLRKNRMIVVQVREAKSGGLNIKLFGGGIKTRDVVIFTRQFATMINAGLPLVQALDILAQQTENKDLASITKQVVYDVESGHTLADALRKHPKAFTDLYVNMVAAGEAGGILDTILLRLAQFLEKNDAIIRKVKGAMIYPAVIFSVAGIAIAVLLIFVIPTFQSMFASAWIALPLPTRIVILASDLLQGYWWLLILLAVGVGFGARPFAGAFFAGEQGDKNVLVQPKDAQAADAARPANALADPKVRKIAIDLGIYINFGTLHELKKRSKDNSVITGAHYAIGEIDYKSADAKSFKKER